MKTLARKPPSPLAKTAGYLPKRKVPSNAWLDDRHVCEQVALEGIVILDAVVPERFKELER